MQMTPDARAWLDGAVRRILARHALGEAERAGVTYELMSHLHAAGEARAAAAGRAEVAREDLEAAFAAAGGEEGLAAAFVQRFAKATQRAPFGRRLGAFALDALVLLLGIALLHGAFAALLEPFRDDLPAPERSLELEWLLPWGFHDPTLPYALQAVIALASAALVLGYFTVSEAMQGRTLGKRLLDLRVLRADGQPMTCRAAFLRSLAKLSPPLLLLDALLLLLAFRDQGQRASDRLADTVVVKVRP